MKKSTLTISALSLLITSMSAIAADSSHGTVSQAQGEATVSAKARKPANSESSYPPGTSVSTYPAGHTGCWRDNDHNDWMVRNDNTTSVEYVGPVLITDITTGYFNAVQAVDAKTKQKLGMFYPEGDDVNKMYQLLMTAYAQQISVALLVHHEKRRADAIVTEVEICKEF